MESFSSIKRIGWNHIDVNAELRKMSKQLLKRFFQPDDNAIFEKKNNEKYKKARDTKLVTIEAG